MTTAADAGTEAREIQVEHSQIEKGLASLSRGKNEGDRPALMRAALWNVVAHTATAADQAMASETLSKASADVPQRMIIVRATPADEPALTSRVRANIHPYGGGRQVYSEEISLVASGDRVHRVPPLVESLLIPDMPVGVWWIGDLPTEREEYVESLLGPADRLIVDSVHFDHAADLDLMARVAEQTFTSPTDLNWVRLEEWRAATASIFDPLSVRPRLRSIQKVRVVSGTSDDHFGQRIEALLYASWLSAQLGHHVDPQGRAEGPHGTIDYTFEYRRQTRDAGRVAFVELRFDDGSTASISRDRDRGFLSANVDGMEMIPASITRARACELPDLIARQLKHPEIDRVFVRTLPVASRLAKRINQ